MVAAFTAGFPVSDAEILENGNILKGYHYNFTFKESYQRAYDHFGERYNRMRNIEIFKARITQNKDRLNALEMEARQLQEETGKMEMELAKLSGM